MHFKYINSFQLWIPLALILDLNFTRIENTLFHQTKRLCKILYFKVKDVYGSIVQDPIQKYWIETNPIYKPDQIGFKL